MSPLADVHELGRHSDEFRRQIADAVIVETVCKASNERPIVDPAGAAKLLDRSLLVYDDDGRPQNVLEALDELLEEKPFLTDVEAAERARREQDIRANRLRGRTA